MWWAAMVGGCFVIVGHSFHLFGSVWYLLPGAIAALAFSAYWWSETYEHAPRKPQAWACATGASFVIAAHSLEWDVPTRAFLILSSVATVGCAYCWFRTANPDVRDRRSLRKRALFAAWFGGWFTVFTVATIKWPSWGEIANTMLHSDALWVSVLYGVTFTIFWAAMLVQGVILYIALDEDRSDRAMTVRLQSALAEAQEHHPVWWRAYWVSVVMLAFNIVLPFTLVYMLPWSGVAAVFAFAGAEGVVIGAPCQVWLWLVHRNREQLAFTNPTIGLCDTMIDVAMPEERSRGTVKTSIRLADKSTLEGRTTGGRDRQSDLTTSI